MEGAREGWLLSSTSGGAFSLSKELLGMRVFWLVTLLLAHAGLAVSGSVAGEMIGM